jgi:hypothetical protein
MSTLTLTNRTSSRLPIGSFVGVLEPNEVRTVALTSNELELTRPALVALAAASAINWTTSPSADDADNEAEPVLGGARLLAGTGVPGVIGVIGELGDLYVNKSGGAGTTLYVKEADAGASTGWAAK